MIGSNKQGGGKSSREKSKKGLKKEGKTWDGQWEEREKEKTTILRLVYRSDIPQQ